MPEYGIVDSHIHVWDLNRFRYTWLDGNEQLERDYSIADFRDATAGTQIEHIVFVQAAALPEQALAEAEWVDRVATTDEPRITGIVADAPLELGAAAAEHLDRLKPMPRVRGIRRLIQIDSDPPALVRRDSFIEGVRLLREYGYTFDICVQRHTLPAVADLVRACPDVQFVLNHLGNPNTARNKSVPWLSDLARVAQYENVACKLSGMLSLAAPDWTVEKLHPYAEHVIESFGPDRVMYGSDWPVMALRGTYRQWVDAVDAFLSDLSDDERRGIWHDNAVRVYGLDR